MLTSIDHVGRVVDERRRQRLVGLDRRGQGRVPRAVGPVDQALLAAFEVEQECRELVYAARFLPRWRYAPMATLRARFG